MLTTLSGCNSSFPSATYPQLPAELTARARPPAIVEGQDARLLAARALSALAVCTSRQQGLVRFHDSFLAALEAEAR